MWLTLCVMQGMLLDCDAATLTVWVNGERKGVMVRPGMTDDFGEPVGGLEGPLRWAVDVGDASVAIAGPLPPPSASSVSTTSNRPCSVPRAFGTSLAKHV